MTKLDDIKAGDEVAVSSGSVWGWSRPSKAAVERVTATQIATKGNVRFSRRTGRGLGDNGDLRLELWGERHDRALAEAAIDAERGRVLYAMEDRVATRKLTLDQLRRIEAILQEARE